MKSARIRTIRKQISLFNTALDFEEKKSPKIFGLNELYFRQNIAKILLKYYDFAIQQHNLSLGKKNKK